MKALAFPHLTSNDRNLELWTPVFAALTATARLRLEKVVNINAPPPFFEFVIAPLEADAQSGELSSLSALLLKTNLVAHAVSSPNLCPLSQAIRLARAASRLDPRLDQAILEYLCRPPRKGPEDDPEVEILHTLEVIDAISDCDRLVEPLLRFLKLSQRRVRSIKLMAMANRSPEWAEEIFADTNPRVRSNLMEGIATQTLDYVEPLLRKASKDKHHRVATTALLGLCRRGDRSSYDLLQQFAAGVNPEFKMAADWALGQLRADRDPSVSNPVDNPIPSTSVPHPIV
jgi:hypothetical protein